MIISQMENMKINSFNPHCPLPIAHCLSDNENENTLLTHYNRKKYEN